MDTYLGPKMEYVKILTQLAAPMKTSAFKNNTMQTKKQHMGSYRQYHIISLVVLVMFFFENTPPSACIALVSSNFDIWDIFRLQPLGRGCVDNTALV